jgi:hypothetical protein
MIDTPSLLSIWCLSDARVRRSDPASWSDAETLRERVYDAFRGWLPNRPDHQFDNAWLFLKELADQPLRSFAVALENLQTTFLEERHGQWHVKAEALDAWQQGLLSRMSALPILAWAHAQHATRVTHANYLNLRLKPFSPLVNDFLVQHGLNEIHAHLNGSTLAEAAWLHALRNPMLCVKSISKKLKEPRIRDLVRSVDPDLDVIGLKKYLIEARRLRKYLMWATQPDTPWDAGCKFNLDKDSLFNDQHTFSLAEELNWHIEFLRRWHQEPKRHTTLGVIYHQYVLRLNLYYQLAVENESHSGFDQFQKYADSGLLDHIDEDYTQRFLDAHGSNPQTSQIEYYEGRFAPKDDPDKLIELLRKILRGYSDYLKQKLPKKHSAVSHRSLQLMSINELLEDIDATLKLLHEETIKPLKLVLVCHFIKKPWSTKDQQHAPYRYFSLIQKLQQHAIALLLVLERYPKLNRWIRGVDGAANELHTPPEFFAPIFRTCKRHGITHQTFHAGEDFPHLLSGLRYMFETLEFLDLQSGDRMGHGTAMGIDPQLWLNRTPQQLLMKQGEWLLSLLAAWRLCEHEPTKMAHVVNKVAREIDHVSVEIFGRHLRPRECEQALALRHLSLPMTKRWVDGGKSFSNTRFISDGLQEEFALVHQQSSRNAEAFQVYWQWQTDRELWKRCEKQIRVNSNFLDAAQYVALQQALMQRISQRGVVMETLPSSNVRISVYQDFSEHHALRWMKAPNAYKEGDPDILVALGSDDPGIFATDLATEFHHLFIALKNTGLHEDEALRRVAEVNQRGRIYRFHSQH